VVIFKLIKSIPLIEILPSTSTSELSEKSPKTKMDKTVSPIFPEWVSSINGHIYFAKV
jgi:hypothetical protein